MFVRGVGGGGSHHGLGRMKGGARGYNESSLRMTWHFPQAALRTCPHRMCTDGEEARTSRDEENSECEEEEEGKSVKDKTEKAHERKRKRTGRHEQRQEKMLSVRGGRKRTRGDKHTRGDGKR